MRDDLVRAPAQRKLLEAILSFYIHGEHLPNYQTLAGQLGISKSRLPETIQNLKRKGFIKCKETPAGNVRTGSVTPTDKAWEWWSRLHETDSPSFPSMTPATIHTQPFPIYKTAGAGNPAEAEEGDHEQLSLPVSHVRGADTFLVEVRGNSMAGDDLRTGDHVIVDPDARWNDGDMVVVADEGAMLVKRLWREGASIILESSNPENEPITLEQGREHLGGQNIRGKVIGVVLWHVKPGRRNNP
jgi:SOS-response transcriptional repressor LexA